MRLTVHFMESNIRAIWVILRVGAPVRPILATTVAIKMETTGPKDINLIALSARPRQRQLGMLVRLCHEAFCMIRMHNHNVVVWGTGS